MAKKTGQERKEFIRKLKNRYRMVVINDTTFDERFSAYLTPLNVIAGLALIFIVITGIVLATIVLTPLKEYIPGYSDTKTRKRALEASLKADSMVTAQAEYESYFANLRRILTGKLEEDTLNLSENDEAKVYSGLDFSTSRADSLLRVEIEKDERYALSPIASGAAEFLGLPGVLFFTPLKGNITSAFDRVKGHYGIDVTAAEGEAVKAVYDGVVTLASFTSDGGNVIQIQHPNNLISIYKHNSALLKKVGDQVTAGESVAIIGNTGEFTDGAHLHFELWYNGSALDPQDFIAFEK